jgi:hypothetical protein
MRITAGCPGPNLFEDCQVSLVIGVPATITADVSAGSGSISVQGLAGPLHLAVTSGSIAIRNVSGPVWASTGSGSISGTGVASASMEAVIGSGSLRVGLAAGPGDLDVAIGSGSARIVIPPGTHLRVLADAGSGQLQVAPGIAQAGARHALIATIGTGQLVVAYPQGRAGS